MTARDKKTKPKGAEKASKDLGSPEGPTKARMKVRLKVDAIHPRLSRFKVNRLKIYMDS